MSRGASTGVAAVVILAGVVVAVVVGLAIVPMLIIGIPGGSGPTPDTCLAAAPAGDGEAVRGVPEQWVEPVTEAAKVAGVAPAVIAAQIDAESGWDPQATSHAGAVGLAQFMPGTWAQYGNGDPYDPVASITAQGAYMAALKEEVPDEVDPLRGALAAYNAGPGTMAAIGWDLGRAPAETVAYVAKILDAGQTHNAPDCAPLEKLDVDLGDGQWAPPLPGGTVVSGYGPRNLGTGPGWANNHVGVDIASDPTLGRTGPGEPVVAVAEMRITRATCDGDASMGCHVVGRVTDGDGVLVGAYHLHQIADGIVAGRQIPRGTRIGVEGNTGSWAFPSHLHFEVYRPEAPDDVFPNPFNASTYNVDPTPILRKMGAL